MYMCVRPLTSNLKMCSFFTPMTWSERHTLPFAVLSITKTEESNAIMPLLLLQFYKDKEK